MAYRTATNESPIHALFVVPSGANGSPGSARIVRRFAQVPVNLAGLDGDLQGRGVSTMDIEWDEHDCSGATILDRRFRRRDVDGSECGVDRSGQSLRS
jgi:hypothetical protein